MLTEVRCSSLSRVMNCRGSVAFKDLIVEDAGDAAREGTAAGEVLQAMLEQQNLEPKLGAYATNGYLFDDDMRFFVRPIAQSILERAVNGLTCEERVDWTTKSGIVIRGQYDMAFAVEDTLYIEDLKYGWGIVEVEKNWQLLGYAIGNVFKQYQQTGWLPKRISLTIHQPRPHHEQGSSRVWIISYDELIEYYKQIEETMAAIAAGDKTLTTGSHCRYCPAASEACPAFNRAANNTLDLVFNEFVQDSLTDEQIAHQLKLYRRAAEILKTKADSLKALGVHRVRNGGILPGFAMTESFGHRAWKEGVDPSDLEVLKNIKMTKSEYITPAQAEKLGVDDTLLEMYSTRFSKGFDLKPSDINEKATKIFGKK